MQSHAFSSHSHDECIDNLHRILTGREDTLIVLHGEAHTFLFPPGHQRVLIHLVEESFHELMSARIDLLQALYVAESIGQIAASTARDAHFG